jgi:hypothetical protein
MSYLYIAYSFNIFDIDIQFNRYYFSVWSIYFNRSFCIERSRLGLEIMASIETVVQNADVEMGEDSKPDSTAEVKDEPGNK